MDDNKLDQATIDKIKQGLENEKKQILDEMNKIAEQSGDANSRVKFPDYGSKSDEQAQEIDEYTKNVATEKVLENSLRDVKNALKSIADGTYGICKYCQESIGKKRLLARPVASTCVACKTKLQNS